MFYLPKDDWSPRFESTFFTLTIPSRTKYETSSPITNAEILSKLKGNTNHPAIYFNIQIQCGRETKIIWRRYSQFRKLFDEIINSPPPPSHNARYSTTSTLRKPKAMCFFHRPDDEFLEKRQKYLESFLDDLLRRNEGYFVQHPYVRTFLELDSFIHIENDSHAL